MRESTFTNLEFYRTVFGTVTKSEIDGQVVWSLPCNLDVGLPNNPRSVDEGLACYFLRLFEDGIVGLTGPAGPAGANGVNGNNAYTVTTHGFTQPTTGNPNVQVSTAYNPAIFTGSYVNIQTSGWYLVLSADTSGVLFLQLVQAVPGATGTITAGKLVAPTGPPGASVTGPTGPQGPQGVQGPSGNTATNDNDYYYDISGGTDYGLGVAYAAVNFTNSSPAFLLPNAGTYLLTVVATVAGLGGVSTTDAAFLKLQNTSTATPVPGSEKVINNLVPDQYIQIVINSIVTTLVANQNVALYGRASGAGVINVIAANTSMTFVQIS